jgi:hypothetical protein
MPYKLADFDKVFEEGFAYQLPIDVREIIETLSNEVGSPGYICTPSFVKKHIEFKPPVVKPTNPMDEIRKYMNKISDRTFEPLREKIVAEIQCIDEESQLSVSELLFTIASGNAFYSKLYARLYKHLCETFEHINPPKTHDFVFAKAIEYCNPNEDYDQYCDITKTNEERRALALFCVNLLNEDTIDEILVTTLLDDIQERFEEAMLTPETTPVADELSEIRFITLTNVDFRLKEQAKYFQQVVDVTKMKQTPKNGLSSKTIFKHMDMLDIVR